jgi:glycosyltransferase involved in cell wall biosynthesis
MSFLINNMKKKILFIMPSLVGGGAENAMVKYLKAIDYNRYDVSLLLLCLKGVYIEQLPKEVKVLYLFKNQKLSRLLEYLQKRKGITWPLRMRFNQVVNEKYDTAICFLDSNVTDLLFFLDENTKKVSFVHSSYVSNKNFNKFYQNEKYLNKVKTQRYAKLDTIVFVSNDARLEFEEVMGEYKDMRVLYNLFNEDEILEKSIIPLESFDKETFSFVAVGSLLSVKGYNLLIEASSVAKKAEKTFKVHILGKGPEEEKLKKLVNKLNLSDTVLFHGYKQNPFSYIKNGNVFVMTSVSEALPSVLCEAIIIGKPILITNTAGCREVIDFGKYGVMTNRDANDFAGGMIEFMDNEEMLDKFEKLSLERRIIFKKENILKKFYDIID